MKRLMLKRLALALTVMTCWRMDAQQPAPDPSGSAQPSNAAPPPSAPAKRSAAELQKLAEPIALHPDPLLAVMLPAAAYPVEIVQAARFVRDTNNISKVDAQSWDENVKAVAKFPQLIAMMDSNLTWTVDLGEAFIDQPKDLMDAIQTLRGKAVKAGTLQTSPQQIVNVTNITIVQTNITEVVSGAPSQIVEIVPANPQIVYVPSYPPTVYYPPPAYVYNPVAPLISFGVGMAWGAILANNCDWHHGGVWCGGGNVNINNFNNFNNYNNINNINNRPGNGGSNPGGGGNRPNQPPNQGNRPGQSPGQGNRPSQLPADANRQGNRPAQQPAQKWQPDQNRMRGNSGVSASTREARGWGSGGAQASTGAISSRPSTGTAGNRPSTGNVASRPSGGYTGQRPSTGAAAGSRPTPTSNFPGGSSSPGSRGSSSRSAFSGANNNGAAARNYSNRGNSSRSGGGFSGGRGGSRGGGRRR